MPMSDGKYVFSLDTDHSCQKCRTKEQHVVQGQCAINTPVLQSKHEKLSLFLHQSLPSRQDIQEICKANSRPYVPAHQFSTMSYNMLGEQGFKSPESFLEIPGPDAHPVILSRYMMNFVTFLQNLQPEYLQSTQGLTESPRVIAARLADFATSLVTTNDELLGSIEGLECLIIQSVYLVNIGSLRRSWVSCRRAISIAQLMGLHRANHQAHYKVLDSNTSADPEIMWFRIVDLDRHLCLMLGLPQGSLDRSMASEVMLQNDTSMGRLERIHCVTASRILERNDSGDASNNLLITRTLDMELQRAARSLPSKWWLAPNLGHASDDALAIFLDTRRLYAQVLHYNLINQLHLPYMLRSSPTERTYEYSRTACTNASREVLSRFLILRGYNQMAYSCRHFDFLALMAAMTLLLAHLDSQVSEEENLLAHQYVSDRAMVEQVQESMDKVNRLNSDSLSAQSSVLLRRLLAVDEVDTAEGLQEGPEIVSVLEPGTAAPEQSHGAVVNVHIPYFGIVNIARGGARKDNRRPQTTDMLPASRTTKLGAYMDSGQTAISMETFSSTPKESSEINFRDGGYLPDLAAGGGDWAFQGVDMTFFESVMRSAGNDDTGWNASATSP